MTHRATGILISWACGLCGVSTAATARICLARDQWAATIFCTAIAFVLLHLSFNVARAVERLYPR